MALYDINCDVCGEVEEIFANWKDDIPICPICGSKRTRLCNCSHFELKYDSKTDICAWGNENYNTTQRYRYVDKTHVNE